MKAVILNVGDTKVPQTKKEGKRAAKSMGMVCLSKSDLAKIKKAGMDISGADGLYVAQGELLTIRQRLNEFSEQIMSAVRVRVKDQPLALEDLVTVAPAIATIAQRQIEAIRTAVDIVELANKKNVGNLAPPPNAVRSFPPLMPIQVNIHTPAPAKT